MYVETGNRCRSSGLLGDTFRAGDGAVGNCGYQVCRGVVVRAVLFDGPVRIPLKVRVAARLPNARLHVYGREAAHEILRELDPVRRDAFGRIEAFLDEAAR